MRSPEVDEKRMRPGHWLGSVLCVPFSALTQTVQWQKGHLARRNSIPLIPSGSLPEKVEEEDLSGVWSE